MDKLRVQLLLKALGATEYSRLLSRLSPIQPDTKKYAELVQILKTTFGPSKSIFRRRHDILSQQALLTALEDPEDIVDRANLKGDQFEWGSMNVEKLKIFLAINYASGPAFKNLRSLVLKAADEKRVSDGPVGGSGALRYPHPGRCTGLDYLRRWNRSQPSSTDRRSRATDSEGEESTRTTGPAQI